MSYLHEHCGSDLLDPRLFASLNMKPVWEGVRSKNMTETVYKLPNGFAMAAIAAYSPSPFTEMTPNVLKKWRQDVQGASERLVQLLAVSPLEHFFDNKLFKLCQAHKAEIGTAASKEFFSVLCDTSDFSELRERFSPEQLTVAWSEFDRNNAEAIRVEKYFSSIGKFSDLLQELSRDIQTMEITPTFRPNGAEARRTHFVRCLTNYFINKYGTPKREWVAITTAAAFDDEAITARQVARLAPVPDTKKKKTAA